MQGGFDMNRNTKNLLIKMLALSALLAFAVISCDFKPSTAFDGFDGQASSGIIDEQGATLRGTFQGSQSNGRASRAQRAFTATSEVDALTVYVFDPEVLTSFTAGTVDTGKAIGSTPIEGGSFTLRGLPDSFTLVFVDAGGNAVGDYMSFEGVKPNQEIDIVVALDAAGYVTLLEESRTGIDHDDLEFSGPARDVQYEDNPMNGSLYVDKYYVVTRAGQTSIRKGNRSLTLEDIENGAQVKVRGIRETAPDGSEQVFAQEIKLQEEEEVVDPVGGTTTVCHIPPGNPENAKTLEIPASDLAGHLGHGDTMGPCK